MRASRVWGLWVTIVAAAAWPGVARGTGDTTAAPTAGGPAFAACTPETAARLAFVEERLRDGRAHARYWWGGWTAFYGVGTVVTSVQAATEDDRGERANDVVSAAKAAFGTTRLLLAPPIARQGAAPLAALPAGSEDECRARLDQGEKRLRTAAREARGRSSWKRHLFTVAINVAGGVIVAEGFDEPEDGWTSAGIGIAVGEAMLWSHPWRQTEDLAAYERRFPADGMPHPAPIGWRLVPLPGGAALHVAF